MPDTRQGRSSNDAVADIHAEGHADAEGAVDAVNGGIEEEQGGCDEADDGEINDEGLFGENIEGARDSPAMELVIREVLSRNGIDGGPEGDATEAQRAQARVVAKATLQRITRKREYPMRFACDSI